MNANLPPVLAQALAPLAPASSVVQKILSHTPPVICRRCDGVYKPTTGASDACCDSLKNAAWNKANDRAAMALQIKHQDTVGAL